MAAHPNDPRVKVDAAMLAASKRSYTLDTVEPGQIGPEVVVEGWTEADTTCLN